jgi:hypothetical protein
MGDPTIIASVLSSTYTYDDFAIDANGNAYITNHSNQLTLVTASGSQSLVESSTSFDQTSAAAFGRTAGKTCTLNVATGGTPGTNSGVILVVKTC